MVTNPSSNKFIQRKNSEVPKEQEIQSNSNANKEDNEVESLKKIQFVDSKDPKIKFRPNGCLMASSYLVRKVLKIFIRFSYLIN